jgi:hypothetical protein|tara:strand:- start:419 stop:886 length:468 start_codon:yes stop_codon:yes gene_type:complete
MLKIRKTSILLLCIVAITSCGFKKINMLDAEGFAIQNIKIIGNKRIGHDLKNDILSYSSKKNENKLEINLEIKKGTVIKERDISSKITKNTIFVEVIIMAKKVGEKDFVKKRFVNKLDYDVVRSNSLTLSNEKNSIKQITKLISEDITDFLVIYF